MTFLEFPLVDIAITISPLSTKLSHCLLKTKSNESSFAIDVIVDVSVESAIAGKLLRDFLNLPKNSAAMCCASAALPPFPKITIFLPDCKPFLISNSANVLNINVEFEISSLFSSTL